MSEQAKITCPRCDSTDVMRERRPDGNDVCVDCKNVWPSNSKNPNSFSTIQPPDYLGAPLDPPEIYFLKEKIKTLEINLENERSISEARKSMLDAQIVLNIKFHRLFNIVNNAVREFVEDIK